MAQERRGGFHSLEKKIHDLEEQDRTTERKAGAEGGQRRESKGEKETAERRTPPAAHDE